MSLVSDAQNPASVKPTRQAHETVRAGKLPAPASVRGSIGWRCRGIRLRPRGACPGAGRPRDKLALPFDDTHSPGLTVAPTLRLPDRIAQNHVEAPTGRPAHRPSRRVRDARG